MTLEIILFILLYLIGGILICILPNTKDGTFARVIIIFVLISFYIFT